jgi:isopenicillin N synthase-like dioxygenase
MAIMQALEISFAIPKGTFLNLISHKENASEMRLNHYPAIDMEEFKSGRVSRIWPHFDLGVITLLFQDLVGGLECENREQPQSFQRVHCGDEAEMVVNVSETLQRWTNNVLKAGLHRVTMPEIMADKETGTLPARFSIAYFCKANRAASVGVLKAFVRDGEVAHYSPKSAIEYHRERLLSAY